MSNLFQHLQPAKKFRISVYEIAQLLNIPQHLIVRVECWQYILFVHRRDIGGQFISYRKLEQWRNAIACKIQKCSTRQQLQQLWMKVLKDRRKYKKQYDREYLQWLRKFRLAHWEKLRQVKPYEQ